MVLKKIFSVHLSKRAFDHLVGSLGLQSEVHLSRYCTAALKDLLDCGDATECAKEIANFDLSWSEPLESPRIVVSSSKCEREAINLAAEALSVSPNQVCSILINWSVENSIGAIAIASSRLPGLSKEISVSLNHVQQQALSWAISHGWGKKENQKHKVYYAELGTGSGKTLLALSIARIEAKEGKRTWISVPSLAIQKQFMNEYVERFGKNTGVLMALVSGRREFVSESRLNFLIQDELSGKSSAGKGSAKASLQSSQVEPDYSDWVARANHWLDRLADKPHGADRRRWLMGSFLEHVPDFPYTDADICITTECPSDDSGVLSYEDQFNLADRADIVVMSHHYLALETMARVRAGIIGLSKDDSAKNLVQALYNESRVGHGPGQRLTHAEVLALIDQKNEICSSLFNVNDVGRLVLPSHLLVDEAHMLEENFSSANTLKISIRRLPSLFARVMGAKGIKPSEGSPTAAKIHDQLHSVCNRMSSVQVSSPGVKVFLNFGNPPVRDRQVVGCAEDLATIMTSFSVSGSGDDAMSLRRVQYAFKRMLSAARYNLSLFSNSPIRQYPQILFGSANHASDFRLLFKSIGIESTLLLSATIFLPSIGGAWSSTRFLSNLGLRAEEACGLRADAQDWLTNPVSLYLAPKPSDVSRDFGAGHSVLLPSNDAKESQVWIKQLAIFCSWSVSTAAGGTLILMTSYESASNLHKQLLSNDSALSERLLLSAPKIGQRPAELAKEFLEKSRLGIKPVWIAVGAVWTGLDLSDRELDPADDNTLTDLIIPRTPYSLNQTISAAAKGLTAARHIQTLEEAGGMLKQGIGRLVRRQGVPANRRLFFLDSRIYEKGKKALLNMSTALLRPYGEPVPIPRQVMKDMLAISGPAASRVRSQGAKPSGLSGKAKLLETGAVKIRTQTGELTNDNGTPAAASKKGFGNKKKDVDAI